MRVGNVVFIANETFSVTTHVVVDSDSTQSNKKANENLNPLKRNDSGSAWTQFPNGEWNITGVKKFMIFLYRFNEIFDPNSSKIKVTGTEE